MSKTRIEDSLRLAIFDAYNGKCFYTGEPIPYQDFEVDHIIPESLARDIEEIRNRLGLGDDFNINSIENLVPCRPGLNLRKKDSLFSDNTLLLYFELTKARKATVLALHDKYKKDRRQSNGYKTIDKILASETISLKEIDDYILRKKIKQWRDNKITLNYPIYFNDGAIKKVSVDESHRDLPTKSLALFDNGQGVELIGENDNRVRVHSLSEWKHYTDNGYSPNTNADIRMSGAFEFLDGLITALDNAQMHKISFVSGESMKDLVGRLSARVLIDIEDELSVETIADLVKEGKAEITNQGDSTNSVCIRYGGFLNTFSEQFRADLTNDGIENIFCYVWRNADGGTMGWGETMILGCHSKDGIVKEERV